MGKIDFTKKLFSSTVGRSGAPLASNIANGKRKLDSRGEHDSGGDARRERVVGGLQVFVFIYLTPNKPKTSDIYIVV